MSRREQAVQLRLAGLSRSQIAEALGLAGGGEPLSIWLKDVPAPAWTRRPRAKDDLRKIAVAMREEGRSYREIRDVVGVSKSTLSLWLRDVPLSDEQQRALASRGPAATRRHSQAARANATRRRSSVQAQARAQIAHMSESEVFVAGVVAYWAEGSKNKPWRFGQGTVFINSDPGMIQLFLHWLQLIGIRRERLQFRLTIHESGDIPQALAYWSKVVDAAPASFGRIQVKKHNPKTVRRNVGEDYHGCLVIYVRRSADLTLQIAGWCEGLTDACRR
jgi:hypothetical protein